jgi:tetratricopeptide (TPR) repeat protein
MLETLRQFGNGNLAERGEVEQLRRLHLDHFLSVAAAASKGIQGADEASWDERLDEAAANLQSAFAWACESGDADAALHMVAHLTDWAFWRTRPELGEWAQTALRLPGAPQHSLFSTVHGSAALAAQWRGEFAETRRLAQLGLGLASADESADVYFLLAALWGSERHSKSSLSAAQRFARLAEREGDQRGHAFALSMEAQSVVLPDLVDHPSHVATLPDGLERAIALADETGNPTVRAYTRLVRGSLISQVLDPIQALSELEAASLIADSARSTLVSQAARAALGRCITKLGRPAEALGQLQESLDDTRELGQWPFVWNLVLLIGQALTALGCHEDAALLVNAVIAHEAEMSSRWSLAGIRDDIEAELSSALPERYKELAVQGAGLSASEAADRAIAAAEAAMARMAV